MKVKVNKAGKLYIALTIFLGIAAVNTGNNLLYIVVSVLLSNMLLSGILSYINLKGIKVRLVPPQEVYALRDVPFKVFASREGRFPSFMVEVINEWDRVLFPYIRRKEVGKELKFHFQKRGIVEGIKLTVSSEFPLGMFMRFYDIHTPLKILVFPKPIPTKEFLNKGFKNKEGFQESFITFGYEELKEIKDYRGEPMKLIHWKISAKTDSLKVKDMSSLERGTVILSIDSVSGDVETKLSKLTYLVNELMGKGYAVGIDLGKEKIPPGKGEKHRLKILKALALY